MSKSTIHVALREDTAWVRVVGRGVFLVSHSLKSWLLNQMAKGFTNIIVDISECKTIDSTFMGMLTGVSIRLKRSGRSPLILANVTPHSRRLLETLGLDKFLRLEDSLELDNTLKWEELSVEFLDKMSTTENMLEAHKQLLDTGTLAEKQFRNVYKMLEDDLTRQKKKKADGR